MNNHLYAINNANYKLEIGMKVRFIGMECKNNTTNPIPSNGIGTIRAIKTSSQNPNQALCISVWFEEWTGEANGHLLIPMVEQKIEEKKSEGIDFVELRKIWGASSGPIPVEFYWKKEPKVNLIGPIVFDHAEGCYFTDFFNQTLRLNDEIVVTQILKREDAAFASIHNFYHQVRIGDVLLLHGLSGFYKVLKMEKHQHQMLKVIDVSRHNAFGNFISPAKHSIMRIYREV